MDEIQHATEGDMAIRNVDRESSPLREVNAVLRRIRDGSFGNCVQCDEVISSKRLAAVPGRRVVSSARRLPIGIG